MMIEQDTQDNLIEEAKPIINESDDDRYDFYQCIKVYAYSLCCFVGSSIGALPTLLSRSGPFPLMVNIIIATIMQYTFKFILRTSQGTLVFIFTTILQQARILLLVRGIKKLPSKVETGKMELDELDSLSPKEAQVQDEMQDEIQIADDKIAADSFAVNINSIVHLFLPMIGEIIYIFSFYFHFFVVLIGLGLASSEAIAQVIGVNYINVIPFNFWILSFILMLAHDMFEKSLPVLAFIKYVLIIIMIIATACLSVTTPTVPNNNFQYITSSYLYLTFTLGGWPNYMVEPFTMIRMKKKKEITGFYWSIFAAIITICIIQLSWAFSVLYIVPQQCQDISPVMAYHLGYEPNNTANCNVSLSWAHKNGIISTIPLAEIIQTNYPHFDWLSVFSGVTMAYALCVIFMGDALPLLHSFGGLARRLCGVWQDETSCDFTKLDKKTRMKITLTNWAIDLAAFILIFLIALFNPKSFIAVISYGAAFADNIMALLVSLMVYRAGVNPAMNFKIPIPMNKPAKIMTVLMIIYFISAVVLDIVNVAIYLSKK
ncbi:hypothetical protein TrispH2_005320 [Trichoplax sp. H2]|nr:hypothetical protein TrispH2_005320 [Trichoplax sp. H2]|eukprot:RDD42197.1 hypothetical protein TrispH2_005320 [Trichoplax sp. H2]